jgi:hypothetical protein
MIILFYMEFYQPRNLNQLEEYFARTTEFLRQKIELGFSYLQMCNKPSEFCIFFNNFEEKVSKLVWAPGVCPMRARPHLLTNKV